MFGSIAEAVFYYAETEPDALFAADGKQSYTYRQAKNAAVAAAARLSSMGVTKGDRVMVECTQNVPYCITQLGIALLGAVFVVAAIGLKVIFSEHHRRKHQALNGEEEKPAEESENEEN